MAKGVWGSVIQLALHKRTFQEKLAYLCKGVIFGAVLWLEKRNAGGVGGNDAISQSSSGDDVYPLF